MKNYFKRSFSLQMKMAIAVLWTAVAVFFVVACSAGPELYQSKDARNGVYYEIFVRAFNDSDGDGIGDFNGVTEKLDYLNDGNPDTDTDLGIDGIWFMPINESPSYHGYDVTDYYGVHKDYGTMDDFRNLLKEAKKRGIKVIMDLVVNHSSAKHDWFIKSAFADDSPYRDWYTWKTFDEEPGDMSAASGSQAWHFLYDKYYLATFWGQMPDLNFDNPAVRNEMAKVANFWLKEGVDGFRLDAAKHIYINTTEDVNDPVAIKKNQEMWQQFRRDISVQKKDAFLVGEVWDNSSAIAPFLDKALDSAFNFDLAGLIISSLKNGTRSDLASYLKGVYEEYDRVAKGQYIDSTFLTNHDQNRVMSALFEDKEKAKMAASILLTLPGIPFLYYGEELGMTGTKPDEEIRLPFPWYKSGQGKGQTDWYQNSFYLASNFERAHDVQVDQPDSMLNHYKKLIKLRKHSGALMEGVIGEYDSDILEVELYTRSLDEEKLLVAHNLTDKKQTVKLIKDEKTPRFRDVLFTTNEEADVSGDTLSLPPYTTVVLEAD